MYRWIHKVAAVLGFGAALLAFGVQPSRAAVIDVTGDSVFTGNCIPFSCPGAYDPFMGFVYRNIPAFTLNPGDTIAFDVEGVNNVPLEFDIFLGTTTVNGGTILSAGGLTLVADDATPADPDGNNVIGDFELVYTATGSFNFAGGGLVIALTTTATTAADVGGVGNLRHSNPSDASGLFVGRFYGLNMPAGGSNLTDPSLRAQPDAGFDRSTIANVIITTNVVPEPAAAALLALGVGGVTARRVFRRR